MYIVDQKVIDMTLEEFQKWEVPKGYRLMNVSGYEETELATTPPYVYFNMHVILQKEEEEE